MRSKLGESLSILQKYNTPLEQATTPSLQALQAYSLGLQSWNETDAVTALPFFQRATQLDTNFAMAYWALGWTYAAGIGESSLAAENLRKAHELSGSVSEREKLIIEGDYHLAVSGDLEKARRTCVLGAKRTRVKPSFTLTSESYQSPWTTGNGPQRTPRRPTPRSV